MISNNLIVHPDAVIARSNIKDPLIAHRNIMRLTGSSVSATSEAADGDIENAFAQGTTDDKWRATAGGQQIVTVQTGSVEPVNYFGIAASDLFQQGGSVRLEYSTDGISWISSSGDISPGNSKPLLVVVPDLEVGFYRLVFNSTGALNIGVISIGELTLIPRPLSAPFAPPGLNLIQQRVARFSETGNLIGMSVVSEGADANINIGLVDPTFPRGADWQQFVTDSATYPFFFATREVSDEVIYGAVTGSRAPSASWDTRNTMQVSFKMNGIVS